MLVLHLTVEKGCCLGLLFDIANFQDQKQSKCCLGIPAMGKPLGQIHLMLILYINQYIKSEQILHEVLRVYKEI